MNDKSQPVIFVPGQPAANGQPATTIDANGAAFLVTQSLHEATFLGTIGAQPALIHRGPALTPDGKPVIRWSYHHSPIIEHAMKLWRTPPTTREWENLSPDEQAIVINHVNAFTHNLKFYRAHVMANDDERGRK